MTSLRAFFAKYAVYVWPEVLMLSPVVPLGTLSGMGTLTMLKLTLLLLGQNASFTFISRARQSSSLKLHAIAAVFSNGFYIFVLTTIVAHYDNTWLKIWYILCTVVGSLHAHYISLHKIENSRRFKKDSLVTKAELDEKLAAFRTELCAVQTPSFATKQEGSL